MPPTPPPLSMHSMPARRPLVLSLLLLAGCPAPTAPPPQPQTEPSASASALAEATPSVSASTDAAPVVPEPVACGALDCKLYPDAASAFAAIVKAESPLVVAVGESHQQKGDENIDSATKRFQEQLLPVLKGKASDLVLELPERNNDCKVATDKVAEAQKPVTQQQSGQNQNEFLALGNASLALEIRPHVLRPSCEQFDKVAAAGDMAVIEMLSLIAELTHDLVVRILQRNERDGREKVVVTYGGALHNDLSPAEGREAWSFGPQLQKTTDQRYVALDIIVPEYIKDNAAWSKLVWYPHFDREAHPNEVTLYHPEPGSYVLIFPTSAAAKEPE